MLRSGGWLQLSTRLINFHQFHQVWGGLRVVDNVRSDLSHSQTSSLKHPRMWSLHNYIKLFSYPAMRLSMISSLVLLATPRMASAAPVLDDMHPLMLVARGYGACKTPEGNKCYGKGFALCNKMCVSAAACTMAMGMCLQTQYVACHCGDKKK